MVADTGETKARAAGFQVVELFPPENGEAGIYEIRQGKNLRDRQRYRVRWTQTPDGGFDVVFSKPEKSGGQVYTVAVMLSGAARGCNCDARTERCKHVRGAECIAAGVVEREG